MQIRSGVDRLAIWPVRSQTQTVHRFTLYACPRTLSLSTTHNPVPLTHADQLAEVRFNAADHSNIEVSIRPESVRNLKSGSGAILLLANGVPLFFDGVAGLHLVASSSSSPVPRQVARAVFVAH